jgi:biopolymer transport protein ExbD
MAIKRQSKVDASFSASSMTDLMFLLLTFFLVLTTLVSPNAIKVVLPQSNSQAKDKAITTVTIDKELNYYVDNESVAYSALETILQEKLAGQVKPPISLHMDKTVPVDEFVKFMNIARRNDYVPILAANPES